MTEAPCFSCRALVPDVEGPAHRYMDSSPGCWSVFGEVLAREYSDLAYNQLHRLTVDAYAVQHPGKPSSPQAVQSVGAHLASLCAIFELGYEHRAARKLIGQLAGDKARFFWLEPPPSLGEVTVRDVWKAEGLEAHLAAVRRWAASAWSAWQPHHQQIKAWIDEAYA